MAFADLFKGLGTVVEDDLEASVNALRGAARGEGDALTRGILERISQDVDYTAHGIEGASVGGRSLNEISPTFREGRIRVAGTELGIDRLANASEAEVNAVRNTLKRQQVPDVFLKEADEAESALRRNVSDSIKRAETVAELVAAERRDLEKTIEKLEKVKAERGGSVRGKFLLAGGLAIGFTELELATQAKKGCWVTSTTGGVTTSCKLDDDSCTSVLQKQFYESCSPEIRKTLISPFYKIQEDDIAKKAAAVTGEKVPTDAASLEQYLQKHTEVLGKNLPELLKEPLKSQPFCNGTERCAACDPTAPTWSRTFLTSTDKTVTISCITQSSLFGTLFDWAGSAANAVIEPLISNTPLASSGSGGFVWIIFIIFAIVIVMSFLRRK